MSVCRRICCTKTCFLSVGYRLKARDVSFAGVATHFIPRAQVIFRNFNVAPILSSIDSCDSFSICRGHCLASLRNLLMYTIAAVVCMSASI